MAEKLLDKLELKAKENKMLISAQSIIPKFLIHSTTDIEIYKAELNLIDVTCKKYILKDHFRNHIIKKFIKESYIWIDLRHPSILLLLGIV